MPRPDPRTGVLHVVPDDQLGGGAVVAAALMARLHARPELAGAQRALLPRNASPLVKDLFAGMTTVTGGYVGRGSPAAFARAILRAAGPGTLVHAHGTRAAAGGALAAAARRGLRCVYTVHGFHGLAQPGRLALPVRLERLLARRVDATAFVSEADAALARQAGLRHRGPAVVIENGMSAPEPAAGADRDIDLLFVGRMVPQKNPLAFLETLSRLKRPAGTVMIGAGELAGEVDARAAGLGLEGFRRIDGLCPAETLAHMARARILVMTSRWEGLPTVAIEAAQSGALVAGFAIPPLEGILGGAGARTLTRADPQALAERLDALLADEPERAALAEDLAGRARIRYAPGRMARRYAELYAQVWSAA